MKKRLLTRLLSLILVLAILPRPSLADDLSLPLGPGVYYLRFSELPEQSSPDSLFADRLPSGLQWKNASRILSADQSPPSGCYFDRTRKQWRGNLKQLHTGHGYWLVLPDNSPTIQITLPGVKIEAGVAPWGSPQGVLVSIENGVTVVRRATPPRSKASYEVVRQPVTSITASSDVYIQTPPGMDPSPGTPGSSTTPFGSPASTPWVKVQLDTLFGYGAREAWVPLAGQGHVTVPPPQFDTPPWGEGDPPE